MALDSGHGPAPKASWGGGEVEGPGEGAGGRWRDLGEVEVPGEGAGGGGGTWGKGLRQWKH